MRLPVSKRPGVRIGTSTLMLCAVLLVWQSGCTKQQPVPLGELAAPAVVPETIDEQAPTSPSLLSVRISEPQRLLAAVHGAAMIAAAALETPAPERWRALLPPGRRIWFDVVQADLDVVPDSGRFFLRNLRAFLHVSFREGELTKDAAGKWEALLARIPAASGETHPVACALKEGSLRCLVGHPDAPFQAEVQRLVRRWQETRKVSAGVLELSLHLPHLLSIADEAMGAVLLWGAAPEEAARLETLSLKYDEGSDRLTFGLSSEASGLFDSLDALLSPSSHALVLPRGLPLVAYTSIHEAASGAERLDDIWKMRGLGALVDLTGLLSKSWKYQLLDLVSGIAGALLVAPISLSSPFDSLVYVLQPSESELLEKRLAYVFSSKYFKIEEATLESGHDVKVAVRKRRKGKGKEYLVWMLHEGTYFFAETTARMNTLAEGLEGAAATETGGTQLLLEQGRRVKVTIDLATLISALKKPPKAGFAVGVALGVLKTSAAELKQPIELVLSLDSNSDEIRTLHLHIDHAFGTLGALAEKLGAFLRLAQM
jgi:hypothetical protein